MSMSRRDFQAIAEVIAGQWRAAQHLPPRECGTVLRALETLAHQVAVYLATTNPRFDRERFIAAALPVGDES